MADLELPDGIAIVGIAALFPGAPDATTFWHNVRGGVDAIGDVPAGRWDPVYFDPDAKGAECCKRAELGQAADAAVSAESPDAWLAPLFLDERSDAYPMFDKPSDARDADDSAGDAALRPRMAVTMGMGNAIGSPRASDKGFLPMTLEEYLALVDWTGRELRADKRGAIPAELLPILERLQIQPESWLDVIVNYDAKFRTAVGRVAAIRREALRRGRRWLQGLSSAAAIFL